MRGRATSTPISNQVPEEDSPIFTLSGNGRDRLTGVVKQLCDKSARHLTLYWEEHLRQQRPEYRAGCYEFRENLARHAASLDEPSDQECVRGL